MTEVTLNAYKRDKEYENSGGDGRRSHLSNNRNLPAVIDSFGPGEVTWVGDSEDKGKKYAIVENGDAEREKVSQTDSFHPEYYDCCSLGIYVIQNALSTWYKKYGKYLRWTIAIILVVAYFVYFGYALYYEFGSEKSVRLLWMTIFVVVMAIILKFNLWDKFTSYMKPCTEKISKRASNAISWTLAIIVIVGVLAFVIVDAIVITEQPYNLVSLSGVFVYTFLVFLTSANPSRVKWKTVLWGLNLQLILALLVLRWDVGFSVVKWLADRFVVYINFTDAGARFVFGEAFMAHWFAFKVNWRTVLWGLNLQLLMALIILRWDVGFSVVRWIADRFVVYINFTDAGARFAFGDAFMRHWFAFKAMPVVVFVSSTIAVLYHLGVMQRVIQIIGWILQKIMDTTAAESMAAAGNIFVGNTEAPLLILPMVKDMTKSELHCLMVGGFATIAGSAFGTFVVLGAKPDYLIAASVMSAPAALALAKLSYPETEVSKTTVADVQALNKSPYRNVIEAASSGAITSIKLVANITVNIIAFLALLEFANNTLTWLGNRAGLYDPPLTFGLIMSYLLFPFALSMGIELQYCRKVAEILGIKAFVNTAFAYKMLGDLRSNKEAYDMNLLNNGTYLDDGDDIILYHSTGGNTTLDNGIISERSLAITTFSLCGFASFDAIGIVLGALVAMVPDRKSDLSQLVIRAVIVGNVASFLTACFAGLLFQGKY